MTRAWKSVYVFISSTFNDMHGERDYLVKQVFPRLHDWCERRKLRLVDIDLRWGVTEADATHNKNVVQVCLDRIDKCRPFFLCFVGQRYGWIPKPEDIDAETFKAFPGLADAVAEQHSVTDLEVQHAAVRPFHERSKSKTDDYRLADHTFFYLRDGDYLSQMPDGPFYLKRTYNDAVEQNRDSREFLLGKQRTLREVTIPSTGRPATAYSCEWLPDRYTPEIAVPPTCPSTIDENKDRWRRDWQQYGNIAIPQGGVQVPDEQVHAANDFNESLTRGRLGHFTSDGQELGDAIFNDLTAAIQDRYPDHTEVEYEDDLQKELDQQEQFLFANSEGFIKRDDAFDELNAYVAGDSRQLFVLTADAGMGKSMLLANWVTQYRQEVEGDETNTLHCRFVGASDDSTTVPRLLQFLLRELAEVAGKVDAEIPADPKEVLKLWREQIAHLGDHGKTVIVIDALNQLESRLSDLYWLPQELPAGVKLIVSFKSDDEAGKRLIESYKTTGDAIVSAVNPFDSDEDRRSLVREYLSQYLKELDAQHIETLIRSPGASNPLYLKVVLSELRVFGSFANLAEKIAKDFGNSPQSAFDAVLDRLESDPAYTAVPSATAVPLLFGLLANARQGLSVAELSELFRLDLGWDETHIESLTETVELFLRQVRPFFARRDGRHDFFYESFLLAARSRYVVNNVTTDPPRRKVEAWHTCLAEFFHSKLNPSGEDAWSGEYSRSLTELPFHQTRGECWEELEKTLTTLQFLEAKNEAGLTFELAADFTQAVAALPENRPKRHLLRLLQEGLRRDIHFIARHSADYPQALFQCLWNSCWWYDCGEAAGHYIEPEGGWKVNNAPWLAAIDANTGHLEMCGLLREWQTIKEQTHPGFRWLRSRRPSAMPLASGQIAVIRGHDGWVRSVAFSADGRRIVSGADDNTVRVWDARSSEELCCLRGHNGQVTSVTFSPDGRRIVSGSWDKTVRVWDAESGTELRCFRSHGNEVYSVAVAPDGRWIASGADDNTVRAWDVESGKELLCFYGHKSHVNSVAFSPDGRRIASGSDDNTVRVWDAENGEEHLCFRGQGGVSSVSFSPDSRRIVSGGSYLDETLRVWDTRSGQELPCLRGHEFAVKSVSFSLDGRQIVSGAIDNTVRVWDSGNGSELRCLRGHEDWVSSVSFSPDGRRIVSGSRDKTVRVWDAKRVTQRLRLRGHESLVYGLSFSPDGRRIVSGARDTTVRIWDARRGTELRCLRGHQGQVHSVAFSADSRRIVSGGGHADETVRVWDARSGEELRCLRGHEGQVASVSFSPDGRRIVSGSGDNTVRVWNVESGEELSCLRGHTIAVLSVSFSPDGLRIASGSGDNTVRVWDAESGAELHCFRGYNGAVRSVSFSPDGQRVVSMDKAMRVCDAESGETLEAIDGGGDVAAAASGAENFPLHALNQGLETIIKDVVAGEVIARFPATLTQLATHPAGHTWAGPLASHIYLITLDPAP